MILSSHDKKIDKKNIFVKKKAKSKNQGFSK
jgi:hypothetical protein